MNLPTGTVTFLFTDIKGSTRLWEEHAQAMRLALTRHDELAAAMIPQYEGVLIKSRGEGDSLFAVFARATEAVACACTLQRRLVSEPWPVETPLQVRMALHTGEADLRDGDYYGSAVNRCARLRATGHGGQVLLSDVTHDLACEKLPPDVSLRSLGEHRLRDLGRPEQVYQVLHPELPSDFLPLRSLDNPNLPNNLPQQVTSFIGREKEIAETKTLLSNTRLLTLTGSGGCGKTRLSLQVAADVLEQYPNGAWLVEFAPLTDPSLVPKTLGEVLGVREAPGEPVTRTLANVLKEKNMLLVLDNCEHVLEAAARLADALLKSCPKVRLLVSSREALGIAGESAYRVPSLSLPQPTKTYTPESLSQYEAVRLFIERAASAKADFAVSNQNAPALAQVCHRLDGIPLAIELAAARIRSLAVEQIAERLGDRFRLLTGGSRTALPRQQTLRAMIDWSYDLLEENQKALLTRLSIFLGGFTLEAAENVCSGGGVEKWEVLDLLTALVDKSLVVAEEQGKAVRYRLLETVRQYAGERLLERGEAEGRRVRHRDYFLALAEEASTQLRSWEQVQWLEQLETEHDNLRAALDFCQTHCDGTQAGLQLGATLWEFWWKRGHWNEGRERLTALLASPECRQRTRARADALDGAACLANAQRERTDVRSLFEESLAIRQEIGDKQGIATSFHALGSFAMEQNDRSGSRSLLEKSLALRRELGHKHGIAHSLSKLALVQDDNAVARSLQEESLTMRRQLGDKAGIAASLLNLGNGAFSQGDETAARTYYEQCAPLWRELRDKEGLAYTLLPLGDLARNRGDYSTFRSLYEQCLEVWRELGNKHGIAWVLLNLGNVARIQGDYASVWGHYEESLSIFREIGDRGGIAYSLEAFAGLGAEQEHLERAARLWGAATALREEIGAPLAPHWRDEYDRIEAAARQALDEEVFSTAWAQGREMTLNQAIEYALEDTLIAPYK